MKNLFNQITRNCFTRAKPEDITSAVDQKVITQQEGVILATGPAKYYLIESSNRSMLFLTSTIVMSLTKEHLPMIHHLSKGIAFGIAGISAVKAVLGLSKASVLRPVVDHING